MSVSKNLFLFVTDVAEKQVFRAKSHINRVLQLTSQTQVSYLLVLPLDVRGRIHNTFFFVNHEWTHELSPKLQANKLACRPIAILYKPSLICTGAYP